MSRTSRKIKINVWLRALIVLSTLVVISLGVVDVIFHLGEGSATIEFIRGDWRIFLGGTCAFFTVIFALLLKAYKQLLKLLSIELMIFLACLIAPDSSLPALDMITKNGWLFMLLILIVCGYFYFAFEFITKGRFYDLFEEDS